MHHVLIVDDSIFARAATKKALGTLHGLNILEAREGSEALELMAKHPVEVVITDLEMPGMDGIQLMMHLKRQHSHARVIVLSSLSQPDDRAGQQKLLLCQNFGAFKVMAKPKKDEARDLHAEMGAVQDPALLVQTVREALASYIPPMAGQHRP